MDEPIWCIPWYTPSSQRITSISCKSLIEYCLGDFIKERKLSLDQISVNVFKGIGKISNIQLDCQALKVLGKRRNWPVEIVEGHMEDITVNVPWTDLFKRNTIFKVSGLTLTVQPTVRTEPVSSILKWVFSNWSQRKNFQMEEKQKDVAEDNLEICSQPTELLLCSLNSISFILKWVFSNWAEGTLSIRDENKGEDGHLEIRTQRAEFLVGSINTIMKRLKVTMENTRIRIEHMPKDIDRGIALTININKIDYYDDTTSDPIPIGTDSTNNYIIYTYPRKKIRLEGITLFTDEYPIDDDPIREIPVHRIMIKSSTDPCDESSSFVCPESIIKKFNIASDKLSKFDKKRVAVKANEPILFAKINGSQGLVFTYEYSDQLEGPKLEAEIAGPFIVMLSPRQLDSIIEIIQSLKHPGDIS